MADKKRIHEEVSDSAIEHLQKMHEFAIQRLELMISKLEEAKVAKQSSFEQMCRSIKADSLRAEEVAKIAETVSKWINQNGAAEPDNAGKWIPAGYEPQDVKPPADPDYDRRKWRDDMTAER